MKREITPSSVSDVIPFSYATNEWLENQPSRPLKGCTLGQISKDGTWAWLANGPSLEVVSTESGERLGACYFGVDSKSTPFNITCACELNSGNGSKLIVGLECGIRGGFLGVFDIKTSKIIRGISMPYQVMSVEAISTTGGASYSNHVLHKSLRFMYGIAAVGMVGCSLFLVDLCLDDEGITDDTHHSSLQYIDPRDPELQFKRAEATMHHTNFCISLNDSTAYHGQFKYKATKANKSKTFKAGEVSITSMKYVDHMQSIAVGYSFGTFHIWNLNKLTLDHASKYEWNQLPVVQFVYQEPENDPRNFCYLWVVRGSPQLDVRQDKVTFIALHALMYSNRIWRPFIGNVYEDLHSCNAGLEFDLTCDPYNTEETGTLGSRLLGCYALGDNSLQHHLDDPSRDEGVECSTHSLMVVLWEAWSQESQTRSSGFIGIFDLNQWYQSQMPSAFSVKSGMELCQYLGFFTLEEVMDRAAPDFMLSGQVDPRSVSQFQTTFPAEQHFFPSSLAFKICCLIETGVIHASYLGLQRQILADLRRLGPSVLLEPREVFNLCIFSGLLPKSLEVPTSNMSIQTYQRESVLTISLEHNMIDFIVLCANEWSNREFSGMGCSMRFLLDWAWKKAGQIKTSLDRLCVPLYNCSGLQLDKAKVQFLHYSITQLYQLTTILKHLAVQAVPITDKGLRDLDAQLSIVGLIHMHYLVVLWFYKAGILPEHEEQPEMSDQEFAYPAELLKQTFIHRRQELQQIDSMIRGTDLLLIDGIISHIGEPITTLWEKDGGTGLYPPPSLYALLNVYLLDGVPLSTKHRIVQYLFMDIAACFPEGKGTQLTTRLTAFPNAFSMKMSIYKLTYAFWLLDHKDFEGAISVLLDPVINVTDIEPWQNTLIIKAFLYQNEPRKALKYFVQRRPTMATPEDMQLRLSVLLSNGLIAEAFKFQRENRDQNTTAHLLEHFFLACQQTKRLGTLFQLPLSPIEEAGLVHFLQESREPYAQEMLVMYYLQRNRFVQALMINDRLRSRVMADCDPSSRERSAIRNIIVDGYANVLPKVQHKLCLSSEFHQRNAVLKNEILRPQPLSTIVKSSNVQVMSQATLIRAVLDKVAESSMTQKKIEPFTPFRFGAQHKTDSVMNADNLPFACTPLTPRSRYQQRDAAELVYPNLLAREAELHESPMECRVSPSKRSRYMDANPSKWRTPKYASAELMSILQTPPVRRKTPTSRAPSAQDKNVDDFIAPQSILKVRQMGQIVVPSSATVKTNFTVMADSTSELNEERVDASMESDDVNPEPDILPKQLRFELSDSSFSTPAKEKEYEVYIEDVFMEEALPRISPRSNLKDTLEIAQRVSKTKQLLQSAIVTLPPQEMEVSSSPISEFSFREPLIPQERAADVNLESASLPQLSVSPRRPLRNSVDHPVFAPPKEVLEPDSSRHVSSVSGPLSEIIVPVSTPMLSCTKPVSAARLSPIVRLATPAPLPVHSLVKQEEILHFKLDSSSSAVCVQEAEPHIADMVLSDVVAVQVSADQSSPMKLQNSDLERPCSALLKHVPLNEKTPDSENRHSMSPNNSSCSKFTTPESPKSSPVGSLQTAHSRLSTESSAGSSLSISLHSATSPVCDLSLQETVAAVTTSVTDVVEVVIATSTVSSTGSPKSEQFIKETNSSRESTLSFHSESPSSPACFETVSSTNGTPASSASEHSSLTSETLQVHLKNAMSNDDSVSPTGQVPVSQSPSVSVTASAPEDLPASGAGKGSPILKLQASPHSPVIPILKDIKFDATNKNAVQEITPFFSKDSSSVSSTTDLKDDYIEIASEKQSSPQLQLEDEKVVKLEDAKIVMRGNASPLNLRPRGQNRSSMTIEAVNPEPLAAKDITLENREKDIHQNQVKNPEDYVEEYVEEEVEPLFGTTLSSIAKKETPSDEGSKFSKHHKKSGYQKKTTELEAPQPMDAELYDVTEKSAIPMEIVPPETPKKRASRAYSTSGAAEKSTRQMPRLIPVTSPKAKFVVSKTRSKLRTTSPEGRNKSRAGLRSLSPQVMEIPKPLTGSADSTKRTAKTPPTVQPGTSPIHTYNTRLRSRSPESITSSGSKDGEKPEARTTPDKKLPEFKEKSSTKSARRPVTRASMSSNKKKINVLSMKSTSSPGQQNIEFSFSPPTAISIDGVTDDHLLTPVESKPFIFSPPLTRARSRRGKRLSETDVASSEIVAATIDTDSGISTTRTYDGLKKRVAGRKSATRSRRLMRSPEAVGSDSPINFVSPVVFDSTDNSTSSVRRSQRSLLQEAPRRRPSVFGHSRKKASIW